MVAILEGAVSARSGNAFGVGEVSLGQARGLEEGLVTIQFFDVDIFHVHKKIQVNF